MKRYKNFLWLILSLFQNEADFSPLGDANKSWAEITEEDNELRAVDEKIRQTASEPRRRKPMGPKKVAILWSSSAPDVQPRKSMNVS